VPEQCAENIYPDLLESPTRSSPWPVASCDVTEGTVTPGFEQLRKSVWTPMSSHFGRSTSDPLCSDSSLCSQFLSLTLVARIHYRSFPLGLAVPRLSFARFIPSTVLRPPSLRRTTTRNRFRAKSCTASSTCQTLIRLEPEDRGLKIPCARICSTMIFAVPCSYLSRASI